MSSKNAIDPPLACHAPTTTGCICEFWPLMDDARKRRCPHRAFGGVVRGQGLLALRAAEWSGRNERCTENDHEQEMLPADARDGTFARFGIHLPAGCAADG